MESVRALATASPASRVPVSMLEHSSQFIAPGSFSGNGTVTMQNPVHSEPTQSPREFLIAGCGYTGLRFARKIQAQGHSVYAFTRSADTAQCFSECGIQPLLADLSKPLTSLPLPNPDVVLWSVGFDRTAGVSRRSVWIDGLQRMLDALPAANKPRNFVLTSSTSVYGDHDGEEVDESVPPSPASEAGQICLEAESLLADFAAHQGDHATILRLSGIYGPARLLRRLEDLRSNRPIPADPDAWLNLVHVDDIVQLLDYVCSTPGAAPLINVACSKTPTRQLYYNTLAELTSCPPPVFSTSPQKRTSGRQSAGNRKIVSAIRSQLPVQFLYEDISAGLRHALQHTDL